MYFRLKDKEHENVEWKKLKRGGQSFVAKLEKLKKNEEEFKEISRTLTKMGKDKSANCEALLRSQKSTEN